MTNIRFLFSSFIIVAQPTGPDGVPVADYVRGSNRSSEKFAKINVRIICLLNHDILQNDVQLSNTGINHTIISRHCLYDYSTFRCDALFIESKC